MKSPQNIKYSIINIFATNYSTFLSLRKVTAEFKLRVPEISYSKAPTTKVNLARYFGGFSQVKSPLFL